MDDFLDLNEKNEEKTVGMLSGQKIKRKILLKEQVIKLLRYSIKVCEDFAS